MANPTTLEQLVDENAKLRIKCARQKRELKRLNKRIEEVRGTEFWFRSFSYQAGGQSPNHVVWLREQYKFYQTEARKMIAAIKNVVALADSTDSHARNGSIDALKESVHAIAGDI